MVCAWVYCADSFLLGRFNLNVQLFDLIEQFALARMALKAFAKLLMLRNTKLLLQKLIPAFQLLNLFFKLSDAVQ